jgi:peptide/nickel transport system permease protein
MANIAIGGAVPRRKLKSLVAGLPIVPALILLILIACALFAPWLAPHDPLETDLTNALKPPAFVAGGVPQYLLGTDKVGRDILSRLIWGSRTSLSLALSVLVIGGVIGTVLGLISGYSAGKLDAVIQRVSEGILSIPTILVALVFIFLLGQGFLSIIIVLSPFVIARFARMIRGEALALRTRPFVELARVAGASQTRIIIRHLLPNLVATIIVIATLEIGQLVLVEASLSFLGVGVPPPTPGWGLMISEGREYLTTKYWMSIFPGIAILATVMSFNLLGDWLTEVLDPGRDAR